MSVVLPLYAILGTLENNGSTGPLWEELFNELTIKTELTAGQKRLFRMIFKKMAGSVAGIRAFLKKLKASMMARPRVTRRFLEQVLPPEFFPSSLHKHAGWKELSYILDYLRYLLFGAPSKLFQKQLGEYARDVSIGSPQQEVQQRPSSQDFHTPRSSLTPQQLQQLQQSQWQHVGVQQGGGKKPSPPLQQQWQQWQHVDVQRPSSSQSFYSAKSSPQQLQQQQWQQIGVQQGGGKKPSPAQHQKRQQVGVQQGGGKKAPPAQQSQWQQVGIQQVGGKKPSPAQQQKRQQVGVQQGGGKKAPPAQQSQWQQVGIQQGGGKKPSPAQQQKKQDLTRVNRDMNRMLYAEPSLQRNGQFYFSLFKLANKARAQQDYEMMTIPIQTDMNTIFNEKCPDKADLIGKIVRHLKNGMRMTQYDFGQVYMGLMKLNDCKEVRDLIFNIARGIFVRILQQRDTDNQVDMKIFNEVMDYLSQFNSPYSTATYLLKKEKFIRNLFNVMGWEQPPPITWSNIMSSLRSFFK